MRYETARCSSLSRRSLLAWKIFGQRLDGWTNDDFATETAPGAPTLQYQGQPYPNAAASRRLGEEMGFTCPLEPLGTIRYRAELNDGMTEHELVHIFRGLYDGPVAPDPYETEGYQWAGLDQVKDDVAAMPRRFSAWFRQYVDAQWPMALARPHSQG